MGLESEDLNLNPSPGPLAVGPESGVIVCEMETLAPMLLHCRVPADPIPRSVNGIKALSPRWAETEHEKGQDVGTPAFGVAQLN